MSDMNVLGKYILMYLYACDSKPVTPIELEWVLYMLAQCPGFEELKEYIGNE